MRGLAAVVTLGIVGSVAAIVAGVAALGCGPAAGQKATTYVASPDSWCPDGYEQGPDDACFALPTERGEKTAVLIYLHDTYKGKGSLEEWAVLKEALAKGFAVVLARGRRDLCGLPGTPPGSEICWPMDPDDTATMKQLAGSWEKTIWQADALLEGGPHRHYVLGYGSGATFAGTLATQGFLEASGYAVVGGGASMPTPPVGHKASLVAIVGGDGDGAEALTQEKNLDEALSKANWAHAKCPRAQKVFSKDDVDVALKLFMRERAGELTSFLASGAKSSPCDPPTAAAPPAKKK